MSIEELTQEQEEELLRWQARAADNSDIFSDEDKRKWGLTEDTIGGQREKDEKDNPVDW